MKNKIFFALSVFSLALSGCSLGEPAGHEHTFLSDWSFDKGGHWHQCQMCNERKDQAEHTYKTIIHQDKGDLEPYVTYKCEVCGYDKEERLELQFPDVWQHDETYHYRYSITPGFEDVEVKEEHVFNEWINDEEDYQYKQCWCGYKITRSYNEHNKEAFIFTLNADGQSYSISADHEKEIKSTLIIPATYNNLPVTKIAANGFDGFWHFMKKVVIPNSIEEIGSEAFRNRNDLIFVVLDNQTADHHLKRIGDRAFEGCSFKSIDLSLVDYVGTSAFTSLVHVKISDHTEFNNDAFVECRNMTYAERENGSAIDVNTLFRNRSKHFDATIVNIENDFLYAQYKEVTSSGGGATVYRVTDNVLVAYLGEDFGNFAIPDMIGGAYVTIIAGDFVANRPIKKVVINEHVREIEGGAFRECKLESLTIKESHLESLKIGGGAFYHNGYLETVTIPCTVESIGFNAFGCCYSLKNLSLQWYANDMAHVQSVKSIGEIAFYECSSLETIFIPKGIETIGERAFASCYNIKSLSYQGTIAEWNSLELDPIWYRDSSITAVHCSDGDIAINNN